MLSIRDLLEQSIASGSVVTIVYNGGSRPGQPRPLIPLSLRGDELVAHEPALRTAKTFKLAKIASVTADSETATNVAVTPIAAATIPHFETLAEYANYLKDTYVARGWSVTAEPRQFSVCGFFKNGKLRKSPTVSIQFVDRQFETALDLESGELVTIEHELTGRERPWRVESKRRPQAKAFAELSKAMEYFANEVSSSSPAG